MVSISRVLIVVLSFVQASELFLNRFESWFDFDSFLNVLSFCLFLLTIRKLWSLRSTNTQWLGYDMKMFDFDFAIYRCLLWTQNQRQNWHEFWPWCPKIPTLLNHYLGILTLLSKLIPRSILVLVLRFMMLLLLQFDKSWLRYRQLDSELNTKAIPDISLEFDLKPRAKIDIWNFT